MTINNTSHIKYINLALKNNRVKTFSKWPYSAESKCSVENMANAGWVMVGNSEDIAAECPFCLLQLDAWEEDDDPWFEHNKRRKDCPYIKLGKHSDEVTPHTVGEIYDLMIEVHKNEVAKKQKLMMKSLEELFEKTMKGRKKGNK